MAAENTLILEISMNNKEKRAKRILNNKRDQQTNQQKREKVSPPKNWKHVYLRSEKLRRAKQLGFDYPVKSNSILLKEYK